MESNFLSDFDFFLSFMHVLAKKQRSELMKDGAETYRNGVFHLKVDISTATTIKSPAPISPRRHWIDPSHSRNTNMTLIMRTRPETFLTNHTSEPKHKSTKMALLLRSGHNFDKPLHRTRYFADESNISTRP